MIKYFKFFYNLLMKLKQYHAMHILVIPSILLFISLYSIVFFSSIQSGNTYYGTMIFLFLYLVIAILSLYAALFIAVILFLFSKCYFHKKIYVKSTILLNNKFYNILFFLVLVINTLILLIERTGNIQAWNTLYDILEAPITYMHGILKFYTQ